MSTTAPPAAPAIPVPTPPTPTPSAPPGVEPSIPAPPPAPIGEPSAPRPPTAPNGEAAAPPAEAATADASATHASIAELHDGDPVNRVLACVDKQELIGRNGYAYLVLELHDRSGAIEGRVFRNVPELRDRFAAGDLVHVAGIARRYHDVLQIHVRDIRPVQQDADPRVLPVANRNLDELDGFLEYLAREEVHHEPYRALLAQLLGDEELRAQWRRAPCTRGRHHTYVGGLLEHTVAVATLAHALCEQHPSLHHDVLLTAALVHDIGKTRQYTYGAQFGLTEHGRLLGHVALGYDLVSERAAGIVEGADLLAILHPLLYHHGPLTQIKTHEARALYHLNVLDTAVKGPIERRGGPC